MPASSRPRARALGGRPASAGAKNPPSSLVEASQPRNAGEPVPSLRELAGLALGLLIAPLFARVSHARRARMLHPEGSTYRAALSPDPNVHSRWRELAERLSGPALLRFSGALWRGGFEHLDVLGIALRLRHASEWTEPAQSADQDLLFATIRSPFTMVFAPLTTRPGDYLANHYWAVSPFDIGQPRHVKFRLSPRRLQFEQLCSARVSDRNEGLRTEVLAGTVQLDLEVRDTFSLRFEPLATVHLLAPVSLDQAALRFSPFNAGRGVVPSGFVHALRRATYAASQWARPAAELRR